MDKKIAAVVVTYNRKDLLIKCLKSILSQTYKDVEIVVVDNASTDGTKKLIEDEYSRNARVQYVNTGSNLGGAGGFSYGIKWAVQHNYNYLWIMDDDTIPTETALEELMKADELLKDDFGFLASYVKWTDGTSCEMNIPMISEEWRKNISFQFSNRMIRLESASFVSILLKAEVVKQVGLPIKEFFIWADDMEYTKRISRSYSCYFVYDSQVVHEMKTNQATSIEEASSDRLERYKYLYRNRYYVASHGAKREKIIFWLMIKNTLQNILKSDSKDKWKRCVIVISSCMSGLNFKPTIEFVE